MGDQSQRKCNTCEAVSKNKHCAKCKAEKRHLKSYPCRGCGRPIYKGSKGQRYCSDKCKPQKLEKVAVECCICKKKIKRSQWDLKARELFACGLECQRKWAFIKNHSTAGNIGSDRFKMKQITNTSVKARRKWKRRSSLNRANSNDWVLAVQSKRRWSRDTSEKGWEKRCTTAVVSLKTPRKVNHNLRKNTGTQTWGNCIVKQMKKIKEKEKRQSRCAWVKKCSSVASNLPLRSVD